MSDNIFSSLSVKLRQQLHISAMNMAFDCGQRFMYRYIMGKKRPPSAYLHVGTATDESVHKNLDHKIATQVLMPRQDVIDIAASKFEECQSKDPIEREVDEKDVPIEQVIGEAKDKSVALAGCHYDLVAPKIEPWKTKRRFSINMDGFLRTRAKVLHAQADSDAPNEFSAKMLHNEAAKLNAAAKSGLDFAGEIDIQEAHGIPNPTVADLGEDLSAVGRHMVVRDTKTGAKSPNKDQADNSFQLSGYALAVKTLDGVLPKKLVLDTVIQTPSRHDLKYYPLETTRTLDDMNTFLNRFTNVVTMMRTGIFTPANPTFWGCSQKFCGYWDICPYAQKKPTLVTIQSKEE